MKFWHTEILFVDNSDTIPDVELNSQGIVATHENITETVFDRYQHTSRDIFHIIYSHIIIASIQVQYVIINLLFLWRLFYIKSHKTFNLKQEHKLRINPKSNSYSLYKSSVYENKNNSPIKTMHNKVNISICSSNVLLGSTMPL